MPCGWEGNRRPGVHMYTDFVNLLFNSHRMQELQRCDLLLPTFVSVEHNSVILQKRRDRSMRHLGYGLGWAEGTMRYLVARMRSRKRGNFGGFPSH